jgi:hypothetical protein
MKPSLKSWATPLVIAAFIISGITGILMFFHKDDGLVKPVHEWLSWALVAGGAFHTVVHWNSFKAYFTRNSSIAIIASGAIIALAAIVIPMQGRGGNPAMKIGKALASAPLETVASVAKQTPEQAIEILQKKGIKVLNTQESIAAIATENNKKDIEVLSLLFE